MKKQLLAIAAVVALLNSSEARIAQVSAPVPLLKGVQSEMYNPVLSPDGSKLLFSAADFSRLRMYDYNDNVTVSVSEAARSGLDAQFTPDSRAVVFVSQQTDARGVNMRSVERYSLADGKTEILAGPSRQIDRPQVGRRGVRATVDGSNLTLGQSPAQGVRTEGSSLIVNAGGRERSFSPVESQAGYLWASLSPDGTKVLFVAAGKGTFVADLNGNIIASLGKYEAPVWYGNDAVVAMLATDDGHQYRSSQIVMMRADGSEVQELTRPESMAMYPAASAAAGRIVYCTIDGLLYQLNVELEK